MNKLDYYRNALIARQGDLSRSLVKREAIEVRASADAFDQIQLAAERDFAVSNLDRAARSLREVHEALRRMDDGSYGVCLRCEDSIPPRRLEAVPWAAYCVACQESVDQDTAGETEHSAAYAEPEQPDHQAAA